MKKTLLKLAAAAVISLGVCGQATAFSLGGVVKAAERELGMGKNHAGEKSLPPVAEGMTVTQGEENKACPGFAAYGHPVTKDPKVVRRSFHTCKPGFSGYFDPALKTPLWVEEHITKENLAGTAKRAGMDFTEDPQIPVPAQGHREDYRGSHMDMGHMAPAADYKAGEVYMAQTFVLSNAVPQEPSNNRGIWANLEGAVREMASRRGELFVTTGPIFDAEPTRILKGKKVSGTQGIAIPKALYKVLVDRQRGEMTAFVIPNENVGGEDPAAFQTTVREVEKLTGLDFNPLLPRSDADKQEVGGGAWPVPKFRAKFKD